MFMDIGDNSKISARKSWAHAPREPFRSFDSLMQTARTRAFARPLRARGRLVIDDFGSGELASSSGVTMGFFKRRELVLIIQVDGRGAPMISGTEHARRRFCD